MKINKRDIPGWYPSVTTGPRLPHWFLMGACCPVLSQSSQPSGREGGDWPAPRRGVAVAALRLWRARASAPSAFLGREAAADLAVGPGLLGILRVLWYLTRRFEDTMLGAELRVVCLGACSAEVQVTRPQCFSICFQKTKKLKHF